jgi:hypothetical protein
MAKSTESGNAKNVSNLKVLHTICTGFGEKYKPSNDSLLLVSIFTKHETASNAMKDVNKKKTICDKVTNEREILFEPLQILGTSILNSLIAMQATEQSINDVKSINLKIQGKRAKPIKPLTPEEIAAGIEPKKRSSISQQGYDNYIEHYEKLIETLDGEPAYAPNETELQVVTLKALHANMVAKNDAVITATSELKDARIARDQILYAPKTGLVDIARSAKSYIKSVFKATSPQYKKVSSLRFTTRKLK